MGKVKPIWMYFIQIDTLRSKDTEILQEVLPYLLNIRLSDYLVVSRHSSQSQLTRIDIYWA